MNLSDIRPNDQNPRTISEAKMKALVKSITEFEKMLSLRPIIVDADGVILGGNMRYQALKQMGRTEIPDEWVKQAADLTDDEKREFIIKDNVGFGEWDWDALANDWNPEQLADWGLEIPDWTGEQGEAQEDDFEMPDEVQTDIVPGDLIEIGRHRLLCGDSTSADDVGRLMQLSKIELVVTSPPYNSGNGGYKTDYGGKTKKFYTSNIDDRTEDEWVVFCNDVLNTLYLFVKSDKTPIVWNVMYTARCRAGYGKCLFGGGNPFSVKETICWDKGMGFPTASKGILSRNWELVFILSAGDAYETTQGENEPRWAKWEIQRPLKQHEIHKATFPVELAEKSITDFSFEGVNVYDPFLGSGTTMVAAHQLNRTCYGMEIDPKYCQVIIDRMVKLDPAIEVKINGKAYGERKKDATD